MEIIKRLSDEKLIKLKSEVAHESNQLNLLINITSILNIKNLVSHRRFMAYPISNSRAADWLRFAGVSSEMFSDRVAKSYLKKSKSVNHLRIWSKYSFYPGMSGAYYVLSERQQPTLTKRHLA